MKLNLKSNHSGFTLIELMIAVAIIGLLATAAVPAFVKFTFEARESEGTRMLLEAQRDQKRVQQECFAGLYSRCQVGDLRFTELLSTGKSEYPTLMYRPPGNSKFALITGNSDVEFFSVAAIPDAKFATANEVANFFGYYKDKAQDPNRKQFMMGAEGYLNGKKHLLGITETGVLVRICDAWTGNKGPGANLYAGYFDKEPNCGDVVVETEDGNDDDN